MSQPFPDYTAVQTGIWYAPSLHYVVFDIRVYEQPTAASGGASDFLGYDEMVEACHAAKLLTAPLLGRGKRSLLQQLPVRFRSRLPAILHLPTIAENDAEGFVIKPTVRVEAAMRPVIKHKIPEFDDQRFDASNPLDPNVRLNMQQLRQLCDALVNDARIASARSKVGANTDAVLEEVVLDVLVDLESVFPRCLAQLSASESQLLQERVAELARGLLGLGSP